MAGPVQYLSGSRAVANLIFKFVLQNQSKTSPPFLENLGCVWRDDTAFLQTCLPFEPSDQASEVHKLFVSCVSCTVARLGVNQKTPIGTE